jgi:hypothetical protein
LAFPDKGRNAVTSSKLTAVLGASLFCLALGACGDKETASSSPSNAQIAGGIQETTVPGPMTTAVPARTGSMSSGTANSDTVAGAAPPGKTNPADAH